VTAATPVTCGRRNWEDERRARIGTGVGIGIVQRTHDAFIQGLNGVLLVCADSGQSS
jgi:hypothetical protein